jgi:hypothetical protein
MRPLDNEVMNTTAGRQTKMIIIALLSLPENNVIQ